LVPALAVAEYDERYAPLLRHLLGHVVIVADGVSEWPLAQFPQLTFISQNGQLVRQRHSIAGGSVGLFEGKRLGRAKNLEKLTEQLAQLATQVTQQDELRATKLAEVQQLKAASHQPAIDRAKRDLVAAQQQFTSARVRHEQLAELIRNNALRTEDFEARLAQLQDELADAEPQNQAATQALAQAEEQLDTLSEQLLGENEELSQRSAAYNELNIKVYQLRNRVETLEREGEYKQTDLQNSRRRAEQATQELAQVQAETQQVIANMDTGDDLLATLHQERDQIEAGVREAETEFYKARGLVEETERLIRDTRRRRELADQLLGQLQNQVTEARLQITAVTERLSVEFEADLEAPQAPNPELDELPEDELRDRQRRTKESLDKIGAINPMAMEAYREIEERYLFINTQKTDLLNAKATLLQTVDEIDAVARENFLLAFGQIREHFIRVFRSLFSDEDSCDLILVEPERPLDSDIDIIAKPKGKRPLTINQLSGGEKTLTATSLLFSIYLLRPAPFCIFDEVDAPLDDANIDKFNRIIRKFADFSQFIIVTHNKRTMAATDIMYGVTMIEQGVSRVVPVDLRALAVE
jgi:chromosome segregation protein